ncbi:hypothetical protein MMYC01_202526 [Madurella mycetomatis]|uniref:Uncharacterized protein n=1 Tax=Madurella mycetomatis TaxID=100816 RepID=A0A175W8S3_9PEZI|nr:hypothetical protein MMYC01_202526 [Madurella mycetomatis]
MVSLRSFVTGAVALMATPVVSALTATDITNTLDKVTRELGFLLEPAHSISPANAQTQIDAITVQIYQVTTEITTFASNLERTPAMTSPDSGEVVLAAFREFSLVNQKLLNTLNVISTKEVAAFLPPLLSVLLEEQTVVISLAGQLTRVVEPKVAELQAQAKPMMTAFTITITQIQTVVSSA